MFFIRRKVRDEIYRHILLKFLQGFDRLQLPVNKITFYFITLVDIVVYNVFFNIAIQPVLVVFTFD